MKYTDSFEKNYRFATPTVIDELYLSRHDADDKSDFTANMFDKFTVQYLADGKWHPVDNSQVTVADNPMYNKLTFAPVKADGVRFINRVPTDQGRHIYKLRVHEMLKESYNLRTVRDGEKLYLFIDGREVGSLELPFQASRVVLGGSNYSTDYRGVLYYHVGEKPVDNQ